MKHKKLKFIILSFIILTLLCVLLPPTRSYLVMSIYSAKENSQSVMHDNGFKIKVPTDKGWYPFVITFNPLNFGWWSKTGADMSIMYNFAKFDIKTLSSEAFDPESKKHSSFYGAYALHQSDGYFGYDGDNINISEIVLTFEYDYKYLVLNDLGCVSPVFEVMDIQITDDIEYLNREGWTKIDAVLETNAMLHSYKENHTTYMQYGKPSKKAQEDFPTVTMYGRLYIKAFDEYDSTIIVYVMSPSMETIEQCDDEILKRIVIKND